MGNESSKYLPKCFKDLPDLYTRTADMVLAEYELNQSKVLPSRPDLTLESLVQREQYAWLGGDNVSLTLVDKTIDLDDLLDVIVNHSDENPYYRSEDGKPAVSLDLETTGLSKRFTKYGGNQDIYTEIVGVGVASRNENATNGFYIPVKHVNTKNHDLEDVKTFLRKLIDKCHIVYHNSSYDCEILIMNGVDVGLDYSDTLNLALYDGLRRESKDQLGLKYLAETLLDRKMLEITEVVEDAELFKVDGYTVLPYGAADVINTLDLFALFMASDNVQSQKHLWKWDIKCRSASDAMSRFNYPIKYNLAVKTLKTLLRRALLVEDKLQKLTEFQISNINSADQVGQYIYNIFLTSFLEKYMVEGSSLSKDELINKLHTQLDTKLAMKITKRSFKNGDKLAIPTGDVILNNIFDRVHEFKYLSDDNKELLTNMVDLLMSLRSLNQSIGVVSSLVRGAYSDDTGIVRAGVELKFMGAQTTRYTNSRGTGLSQIVFKENSRGISGKFVKGNDLCGINGQGVPADKPKYIKAKRLKKLPESCREKIEEMNQRVEQELMNELLF